MLESSPLGFQRLRTGGCAGRLRQIIEHFLVEISSELEEEEPTKEIPVAEKAGFWSILLDFLSCSLQKPLSNTICTVFALVTSKSGPMVPRKGSPRVETPHNLSSISYSVWVEDMKLLAVHEP